MTNQSYGTTRLQYSGVACRIYSLDSPLSQQHLAEITVGLSLAGMPIGSGRSCCIWGGFWGLASGGSACRGRSGSTGGQAARHKRRDSGSLRDIKMRPAVLHSARLEGPPGAAASAASLSSLLPPSLPPSPYSLSASPPPSLAHLNEKFPPQSRKYKWEISCSVSEMETSRVGWQRCQPHSHDKTL